VIDSSSPEVNRGCTVFPAELVKPPVPGQPGHRLQLGSERQQSDRSMWKAGVSSGSLAACPKSELRWRMIGSRNRTETC